MSFKKLIIPATVIVVILIIIFDKNKDVETDQSILQDNLFTTPPINENRKVIADFESCDPNNNLEINFEFGKAKMTFEGISNENCVVETMFETTGGSYTNKCLVPASLGKVEFDGYNFDKISQYCTMNNSDNFVIENK